MLFSIVAVLIYISTNSVGGFPFLHTHHNTDCRFFFLLWPFWPVWNSMKRQKDRTLKDEILRWVGAQYATWEEWRNNSRKNEEVEPKQKQCPVVDVTGDGSKVWCGKEQYCIGTWNVRSMNPGKLEVVKQEMARVNISILGISELDWNGLEWANLIQMTIISTTAGKNPLEEME